MLITRPRLTHADSRHPARSKWRRDTRQWSSFARLRCQELGIAVLGLRRAKLWIHGVGLGDAAMSLGVLSVLVGKERDEKICGPEYCDYWRCSELHYDRQKLLVSRGVMNVGDYLRAKD